MTKRVSRDPGCSASFYEQASGVPKLQRLSVGNLPGNRSPKPEGARHFMNRECRAAEYSGSGSILTAFAKKAEIHRACVCALTAVEMVSRLPANAISRVLMNA